MPATPSKPTFSASWERPFVSVEGGTVSLLIRIETPPAEPSPDRIPVDIAFVLDRSGSMSGDRLNLAKQATVDAGNRLTPRDRMAVVVYDHEVLTPMPLMPVTDYSQSMLRSVMTTVDARGSTNLAGGWLGGCEQLADAADHDDDRVHRVILLTDGHANQGIVDPDELATHAQNIRKHGIATTTLGVGAGFDGPFLSQLAEAGGGNFAFIEQVSDMATIFAQELNELVSITARGVTVSLSGAPDATMTLLTPYPHETSGGDIHVSVGDLPAGTTVELVCQVTLPAAAASTVREFRARGTWRGADGKADATIAVPPVIAIPAAELPHKPHDPQVAEAAAIQNASWLQRESARLARAHDVAGMRMLHERMDDVLRSAPATARILETQERMSRYAAMSDEELDDPTVGLRMAEQGFAAARRRRPGES